MGFVTEGPTTTTPDTSYGPGADGSSERPHLYLVLECDWPLARGARYSLWDVDEVVVGRGSARHARREAEGGVRRLLLRIPGGFVSSLHARFVRVGNDWLLEDARSTNGSYVNGERVMRRQLQPGDVIEIGHKLFTLSVERTPAGMALDLDAASLDGQPGMRTLIPRLAEQFAALRRIAPTGLSVILLGETGTGKELLAEAVHQLSGRSGPLVAVNCGALTANLAESQLFGHGRGAFSGAIRDEPGFVRSADGGSLLLDEIGDLPEAMQPILLRVLQDMRVIPVGSAQARDIDVRFMAATHQDIPSLVGDGRFRRDLLARLNGFTLSLPALRERKQDLGLLIGEVFVASQRGAAADNRAGCGPRAGRLRLARQHSRAGTMLAPERSARERVGDPPGRPSAGTSRRATLGRSRQRRGCGASGMVRGGHRASECPARAPAGAQRERQQRGSILWQGPRANPALDEAIRFAGGTVSETVKLLTDSRSPSRAGETLEREQREREPDQRVADELFGAERLVPDEDPEQELQRRTDVLE